jgi:fatty acid/phospholipid biosynthesis enzyme
MSSEKSNSLHKYLQKSRTQNVDNDVGLLVIGEQEEKGRDISALSHHAKQEKKAVPFASKEERCKLVRPQTSLGPGSYEIIQEKQEK